MSTAATCAVRATARFLLIRHGRCAGLDRTLLGRALDPPLDPTGLAEVQLLARRLRGLRPAIVDTSPRRRTHQTAALLAGETGGRVHPEPALDEVDFGRWAGMDFSLLARDPDWQRWNEARSTCVTPAGESIRQVQARALRVLRARARQFPGSTLIVVSHAEVLRSLMLLALRLSPDEYHRCPLATASVSVLRLDGADLRVEAINQAACA